MSTAIITGASEGLGRALTLSLAHDGWTLVVDARRPEPLESVADEARAAGASVQAIAGDVGDATHRQALIEAAEATGSVDLLVANAGTLGPTPLPPVADLDLGALEQVLHTNTVAQVGLIQAALPALRRAGGTVVAVTSDAAIEGYEGWGAYGSSKAALEQLVHILGAEEPTLRVHRFDPGDMRTRMHQDAFPGDDISDRPLPEAVVPALRRLIDAPHPSGRYRAADLTEVGT